VDEARHAVVGPLVGLASSADYRDRADAGRALAVFADVEWARASLLALLLDPHDTFVTRVTTEALLRRRDAIGYALVAQALPSTDDDHSDWIHTAIADVFGIYERERDAAERECRTLLDDPEEAVREGSLLLITALADLTPALRST
jgi:hypothetical protein